MTTKEVFDICPITDRNLKLMSVPEQIIHIVSDYLKISTEDIKGTRKRGPCSKARRYCLFLIWKYTELTQEQIVNHFSGRQRATLERSSVTHATSVTIGEMKNYDQVKKEIYELCERIEDAIAA